MRTTRRIRKLGLMAALLAVPMLGASAEAGQDKHNDRRQHRTAKNRHHERNDRSHINVDFGIRFGNHDGHHRNRFRHRRQRSYCEPRGYASVRYNHRPRHQYRRHGHWKKVWIPPVFKTRYDECGEPYRVLIYDGYYKKVWVPYGRRHVRHHNY